MTPLQIISALAIGLGWPLAATWMAWLIRALNG